ncbi:hypothetical protein O8I67_04970 [Streptococcus uberis]|uniref:hypothetical protein n=1 Tax=Streptococcus uberis TaxID=1349 RepID=UPI0022B914B0|nr:hypothetical protein [Streptococcus uberis]MCZ8466411.1 hypothetical protein [Streptococcus uberis]
MQEIDCIVLIGKEAKESVFLGVFQHSHTHGDSPMIGGFKAGQISYPVAVVRSGSRLYQVELDKVRFLKLVEND